MATCKQKARQKEECTERVSAPADPGYDFGMDGEGQPEERCRPRNDERYLETAQETKTKETVGDVEQKICKVEAGGVELPEVAIKGKSDPVDGTVREASGPTEVGGEGDRGEQEAVCEGVPVCERGVIEYLVKVVVDERRTDRVPVEGEDPESADSEESKALVREAPLEEGSFGRWFGAEYRGAASGHALF
jgi:hypothetical protein